MTAFVEATAGMIFLTTPVDENNKDSVIRRKIHFAPPCGSFLYYFFIIIVIEVGWLIDWLGILGTLQDR